LFGVVAEAYSYREAQRNSFIEIHDKHLIVRVTGMDEGLGPGSHIRKFFSHAAAVVDN